MSLITDMEENFFLNKILTLEIKTKKRHRHVRIRLLGNCLYSSTELRSLNGHDSLQTLPGPLKRLC